jgi:hypothetical protein
MTNHTLETALEDNKPSASFEGRSNAHDILVGPKNSESIRSKVLKHLTN